MVLRKPWPSYRVTCFSKLDHPYGNSYEQPPILSPTKQARTHNLLSTSVVHHLNLLTAKACKPTGVLAMFIANEIVNRAT